MEISNNPVGLHVQKKWNSAYPELRRMQTSGDGVVSLVAKFLQNLFRNSRMRKERNEEMELR